MNEFKIKPETSDFINISNDDKLGVDYANQFTDLDHQKMDELDEMGKKVLSQIDFRARMETDPESCEIDIVEKKQREFEQSQTEENN